MVNKYYKKNQSKASKRTTQKILRSFGRRKTKES